MLSLSSPEPRAGSHLTGVSQSVSRPGGKVRISRLGFNLANHRRLTQTHRFISADSIEDSKFWWHFRGTHSRITSRLLCYAMCRKSLIMNDNGQEWIRTTEGVSQ